MMNQVRNCAVGSGPAEKQQLESEIICKWPAVWLADRSNGQKGVGGRHTRRKGCARLNSPMKEKDGWLGNVDKVRVNKVVG